MTIDFIFMSGTGNPDGGPNPIADAFLSRLDPRFHVIKPAYPAAYWPAFGDLDYAESKRVGAKSIIDHVRMSPNKCVIGGYSQGADIAGDVAAEIGQGIHPDLEVLAVALIADPSREVGAYTGLNPGYGTYGITGSRPIRGIPVGTVAAQGDMISALPAGSPLRTISDFSEFMSLKSSKDAREWGEDLLDKIVNKKRQDWWAPWKWAGWAGSVTYAQGYLFGDKHSGAYVTEGHCDRLAKSVNKLLG